MEHIYIYIYISYPKRVYNASVLWSKLHYPGPFPLMNVARFYHTPFVKSHFYSTGFSPLSLSLLHEPTHPGNLFSFLLPTIRPPSPPRPTFTCSPQRILSNECNPFWTIDLRPPRFFLVSPKETFPRGIYDTHRCKFRLNRDGWR